jgi:hypothetical protein
MADLTKKVLKYTTTVATAIGKATVKGTVWTAEQVWNHKEKINFSRIKDQVISNNEDLT